MHTQSEDVYVTPQYALQITQPTSVPWQNESSHLKFSHGGVKLRKCHRVYNALPIPVSGAGC